MGKNAFPEMPTKSLTVLVFGQCPIGFYSPACVKICGINGRIFWLRCGRRVFRIRDDTLEYLRINFDLIRPRVPEENVLDRSTAKYTNNKVILNGVNIK